MPQTTQEPSQDVDAVAGALLGPPQPGEVYDLRAHIERLAQTIDGRVAESYYRTLLAHLAEEPESRKALECLVVLGLAHPKLLTRHRVQLSQEGRRLAGILEKAGEVERAQTLLEVLTAQSPDDTQLQRELASMMQRTGNADRLIERYLRRAENALGDGRRHDAVLWLRQVLAIDRSRRDVARMIRDLQYEEVDRRRAMRRTLRVAGTILLLTLPVVGAVWRESRLKAKYASLDHAEPGDLTSLRARLGALDDLIADHPLWLGAFRASRERSELRTAILALERDQAESALAREQRLVDKVNTAESARARGRALYEQDDVSGALAAFRTALENAPPDWVHLDRVRADVAALEEVVEQARLEALGQEPGGEQPR